MRKSNTEINNQAAAARMAFEQRNGRTLYWRFEWQVQGSQGWQRSQSYSNAKSNRENQDDIFNSALNMLLSNPTVTIIRVCFWGQGRDTAESSCTIVLEDGYQLPQYPTLPTEEPPAAQPVPQPQPQPAISLEGLGANMKAMLSLLGLADTGLGALDDKTNGLGTVLQIRDKMIEKRYEDRDRERKLGELTSENRRMADELKRVTKALSDAENKVEELSEKNDELKEKLRELKPNGMLGALATQAVTAGLGNLAVRMAPAFGMKREVIASALAGDLDEEDDEPAAQIQMAGTKPAPIIQPVAQPADDTPQGPREEKIRQYADLMRNVSEDDFDALVTAMDYLTSHKTYLYKIADYIEAKADTQKLKKANLDEDENDNYENEG